MAYSGKSADEDFNGQDWDADDDELVCIHCDELIEDPNEVNWDDCDEPWCPVCAETKEDSNTQEDEEDE